MHILPADNARAQHPYKSNAGPKFDNLVMRFKKHIDHTRLAQLVIPAQQVFNDVDADLLRVRAQPHVVIGCDVIPHAQPVDQSGQIAASAVEDPL